MDKRKKRYYTMGQNNQDSRLQYWATRSSAPSFARTTRLLALHSSLRSQALLHSLICSIAHFAHSLACGTVNDWIAIYSVFFSILAHSALAFLFFPLQNKIRSPDLVLADLPAKSTPTKRCGVTFPVFALDVWICSPWNTRNTTTCVYLHAKTSAQVNELKLWV